MRASRIWSAAPSLGRQANPTLFPNSTGSCKVTRARLASLVSRRVAKCQVFFFYKKPTLPLIKIQIKFTGIYLRETRDILQLVVQWVKVRVDGDGGHRHLLTIPQHQTVSTHLRWNPAFITHKFHSCFYLLV